MNTSIKIRQLKLKRKGQILLKRATRTNHSRLVSFGLFIGLLYLPTYFSSVLGGILEGSSVVVLNIGFLYLGLQSLWEQRHVLKHLQAYEDERLVGHLLILGGAAFFPFCLSSVSIQCLIWMIILVGIGLSTWGLKFFQRYWFPACLVLLSAYPNHIYLMNQLWRTLTPPKVLEHLMAWLGSVALQLMGQPAQSQGVLVTLPAGAVEVASGCSGFDMSVTLSGTGFILGRFLDLSRKKILAIMVIGVAVSLVLNVPRIMLLTFASVYWGKDSFEFWHGPWGGQIFASILFTVYYYAVMAIANLRSRPA